MKPQSLVCDVMESLLDEKVEELKWDERERIGFWN